MTELDLIVGVSYLLVALILGYFVRSFFSQAGSIKFFMPALAFKMICALLLGILYFYYYGGGDTIGYFWGANQVWKIFLEDPIAAVRVIFWDGEYGGGIYKFLARIPQHLDLPSFFVVRVAGFFGLFTFNTYAGTAIFFGVLSFSGSWALYQSMCRVYPKLTNSLAVAILFIPSVMFWGSGILKDTITFSALSWMTWSVFQIFYFKKRKFWATLIFAICFWIIYQIKIYILLCYIPAVLFWIYGLKVHEIRSTPLKWMLQPILLSLAAYFGYYAVNFIVRDDPKYSMNRLAETAAITAYDIRFWTGKEAGSGYDLGAFDDTFQGMIGKVPRAINVSLFRPYLWEANNILTGIMSFESSVLLLFSLLVFFRIRRAYEGISNDPYVQFALIFSLVFAFAVGISTYNFGTLIRYKIPLLPFYLSSLIIIYNYARRSLLPGFQKVSE